MIGILYEDADILAADKPCGLASIPESDIKKGCLQTLLSDRYGQKFYAVHRLDKDVSGVILFAKNAATHRHLNEQFRSRTIRKTYIALLLGVLGPEKGIIDKPLREFGSGRMGIDEKKGKASLTEFTVEKRFSESTLVKAFPLTGRRHQIRVHFYSTGHPVAGDPLYGEKDKQSFYPRLMLHALDITFRLPSEEVRSVSSPLPESFSSFVNSLK